MDKKTYKALKMEEHPVILFQLSEIRSIDRKDDNYLITAEGDLTVAGMTRAVELQVTGKSLPDDEIQFMGEKTFTMTSFDVAPPTAMMGTISTGDEITVKFDITLTTTATGKNPGPD